MDDKQVAVQTEEEVLPSESISPQDEQETPEDVTETAEKPVETPETEDELKFTKEQAKAFQEMRKENKRLQQELEERQTRQSQFEQLNQVYAPIYNQEGADTSKVIDERINDRFDEMQARADYPALNTDKKFERAVAAEYQARLMETLYDPSKKRPSIREIAKEYAPHFTTNVEKVKVDAVKEAKEKLTEKEQASLSATSQNQTTMGADELEALRDKSRHGDVDAIAARIKRIK